jgi:hypothetical protein
MVLILDGTTADESMGFSLHCFYFGMFILRVLCGNVLF